MVYLTLTQDLIQESQSRTDIRQLYVIIKNLSIRTSQELYNISNEI